MSGSEIAAGFYILPRGWLDTPALDGEREPYCRRAAWAWLVERARWQDGPVNVFGKTVQLLRGQLSFSLRYLAGTWRWEESRVRRFLSRLVTDQMVTSCCDAGQTVITVCNYGSYQPSQENVTERVVETQARSDTTENIRFAEPEASPEARPSRTQPAPQPLEIKPSEAAQGSFLPTASIAALDTIATRFEEFERQYPKKILKKYRETTFRSYREAIKTTPHTEIMDGLRNYKFSDDPTYHDHASNWLKKKKWMSKGVEFGKSARSEPPVDPKADPWGIVGWCAKHGETGLLRPAVPDKHRGSWLYGDGWEFEWIANEVAKAARLHISWRGDWQPLIEWLDSGVRLPTIKIAIQSALDGNPGQTVSLRRFDTFVSSRRVA